MDFAVEIMRINSGDGLLSGKSFFFVNVVLGYYNVMFFCVLFKSKRFSAAEKALLSVGADTYIESTGFQGPFARHFTSPSLFYSKSV